MNRSSLIFLPNCLDNKKSGYIKGFRNLFLDYEAFYITSNRIYSNYCSDCIGFLGRTSKSQVLKQELLYLSNVDNTVLYNNKLMESCILIMYDYYGFKHTNIIPNGHFGHHFEVLSNSLRTETEKIQNGRKNFWKLFLFMLAYLLNIASLVNINQLHIKYVIYYSCRYY